MDLLSNLWLAVFGAIFLVIAITSEQQNLHYLSFICSCGAFFCLLGVLMT